MEFQRIPMNEYQTELTEELVNSLPQEVQDQLFDIINNVEFVKRGKVPRVRTRTIRIDKGPIRIL